MQWKRARFNYVFFAMLCMGIFFLGTSFITRNKKIQHYDGFDDENVVEVFKQSDKRKNRYDTIIILRLLSKSNSQLKVYMKQKYKNYTNFLSSYLKEDLKVSAEIKEVIRSQFPTILSINRASINLNKNKHTAIEKDKSPERLEDLILIEDLMEQEEGKLLDDETKNISKEKIPKPTGITPIKVNKEKPYILIYHTHGTEAYLPIKQSQYHTTEKAYNVLTIGEIMEKVLVEQGHKVCHIETYHDIPSYRESYSRSLSTVNTKLKEEPNLKVIFDVHRDGVPENASSKNRIKINVDGKDVATFSMVIGPESPNVDEVLKFAKYIRKVSDALYPGFCTGIIIKPKGKFNQFVSNYCILLEVGSNLNTIDEAKEAAILLGKLLNIVIDNIQG